MQSCVCACARAGCSTTLLSSCCCFCSKMFPAAAYCCGAWRHPCHAASIAFDAQLFLCVIAHGHAPAGHFTPCVLHDCYSAQATTSRHWSVMTKPWCFTPETAMRMSHVALPAPISGSLKGLCRTSQQRCGLIQTMQTPQSTCR